MTRLLIFILLLMGVTTLSAQTYDKFTQEAATFIEKEDYVSAEVALKAALSKEPANPNNPMLLINLGTIQRYLGKYEEALLSYNSVMDKYPNISSLLHSRATLYCEMNKMEDALNDYTTILKNEPKDIEALYSRGLIYMSSKMPKEAEADFKGILKYAPDNLKAQSALAMLLKRQSEWKKAEEAYTDLIYKNKTNAELYFGRAECNLQLKRFARTQEDLMKASEYGYNEYPLYILWGQLRLEQYDKRMAKEHFMKALELGANKDIVDEFLRLCK